jgi:hypothetical protein
MPSRRARSLPIRRGDSGRPPAWRRQTAWRRRAQAVLGRCWRRRCRTRLGKQGFYADAGGWTLIHADGPAFGTDMHGEHCPAGLDEPWRCDGRCPIRVHRPASALNLACLAGRRSVLRGTPDAACQPEPDTRQRRTDSSGRPHHRDSAEAAGKASKKWNHRCTPMGWSSACSFRAEPSRPRLMSSAAALVRSPSVCIGMHLWFHFLACLAACRTLPNGRLDRAAPPGPHPAHPIEPLPGSGPASSIRHRDDWFSARSRGDATP